MESSSPLNCDSITHRISTATNVNATAHGRIHCSSASTAEPKHDSGLSVGAKAAVGVVVGVVGLAIILVALFLLRRRRKRQRLATASSVRLQESTPPTYREAREDCDPPPVYTPRLSK